MKKIILSLSMITLLTSGIAFADQPVPTLYGENPVPTLYGEEPVLISAPIRENVLGYDRLQVADTMMGYGRIIAFETAEEGYLLTIKDEITGKELTLSTDVYTRINTNMFHDLQLGTIIEVFYTNDSAIAINVLDKASQEGDIFIDGTIEANTETTVTVDGKVINLDLVTMSKQAKDALKVGNRAQLVFMTYENDTEYRLKVTEAGDFIMENNGIIKEISDNPLHRSFLVSTDNGDVLLHIFDDTMMDASFAEYKIGDSINFTHSMMMTRSIPPQTTCYSVSVPNQSL